MCNIGGFMKSLKSIAGIASLALVINFGGAIKGHSNVLNNYSISYAHSYGERSSKGSYTKFKFKYNRGTLKSIKGVKINGVVYKEVRDGKYIKKGYYSGNVWGVHKGKELYIQPKVSKEDKVEFLIGENWQVSNKNIRTDSSSGATPENDRDCDKYPAKLPAEKIVVNDMSSLSREEESKIIAIIKKLNPQYDEVRMSGYGDSVKIIYRDRSSNYIDFKYILREKKDCDRYPFVKPTKTVVEDVNKIGRYRSAITQNVKSANPHVKMLDFGSGSTMDKKIRIIYYDDSYIIVDITELVTEKKNEENPLDKLKKEKEDIQGQLEAAKAAAKEAKEEAQAAKDAAQQAIDKANQAEEEAKNAKAEAKEKIKEAENQAKELVKKAKEAEARAKEAEAKAKSAQEKAEARVKELEALNQASQEELAEVKAELENTKKDLAKAEEARKEAEAKRAEAEKTLEELKKKNNKGENPGSGSQEPGTSNPGTGTQTPATPVSPNPSLPSQGSSSVSRDYYIPPYRPSTYADNDSESSVKVNSYRADAIEKPNKMRNADIAKLKEAIKNNKLIRKALEWIKENAPKAYQQNKEKFDALMKQSDTLIKKAEAILAAYEK